MPAPEYSLPDVLERMYNNQLALEAAIMELTLLVEQQGHAEAGDNVRAVPCNRSARTRGTSARAWPS